MTIHPFLIPTLLFAAASTAAAAVLRRAVRKEYAACLPLLWLWGILCTLPALAYAGLCLPIFREEAAQLNESLDGTWAELLAGTAGVLPGLIWDWTAECVEQDRRPPFGLPATIMRAISLAALLIALLIPYVWLFERETPSAQTTAEQTKIAAPPETAPDEVAPAEVAPADTTPAEVAPTEVAPTEVAPADTTPDETAPEQL